MLTIGLVANIYNEANALPGWLETHLPFFDDVRVLHAGPGGEYSTDGTLEILAKWRVPVEFGQIDEGFGAVRTRALRMSPCDWVMLLDADERFYPVHRIMRCVGHGTPGGEVDAVLQSYDFRGSGPGPDWDRIGTLGKELLVEVGGAYDQGARLREICEGVRDLDAVCTIRRHWHDLSFRRPTQNWMSDMDWQTRVVRNDPGIRFDASTKMHERLVGANRVYRADFERGPFFDHYHFWFKRMEMDQRAHDVAIYDAVHEGRRPPTREEFVK